jgi:hypothetical protein
MSLAKWRFSEYPTVLPDEQLIAAEIEKTRRQLEALRK